MIQCSIPQDFIIAVGGEKPEMVESSFYYQTIAAPLRTLRRPSITLHLPLGLLRILNHEYLQRTPESPISLDHGSFSLIRSVPTLNTAKKQRDRNLLKGTVAGCTIEKIMTTVTRELQKDEFYLAEILWERYRGQKADPVHEKIFGVFVDGTLVASARYVKHTDGVEMDCVFVPEPEGGKGYARDAVEELIKQCGSETIYIHSTLDLIPFYTTLGFSPIPEGQLPPSIKERFSFCLGNMEGCNISPMVRIGAVVR